MSGQSFRARPWDQRFLTMGDEAEQVFEKTHPRGWERFGHNRPSFQIGKLSLKMRYQPDYQTSTKLIEVQGFGKEQCFNLKVEKHIALVMWDQDMPVEFFLWDSTNQRYGYVDLGQITHTIFTHAELGAFSDGKRIWKIQVPDLRMEWVPSDR